MFVCAIGATVTGDLVPEGLESWDAWVAIGTLALAVTTAWLAFQTRGLARKTQAEVDATLSQVSVSRDAFEASTRPVIVDVPPASDHVDVSHDDAGRLHVQVPCRNAGAGLALVTSLALDWPESPEAWSGVATHTAIPPGEYSRLDFAAALGSERAAQEFVTRIGAGQTFTAEIGYTDVGGGQPARTRVVCAFRGDAGDEDWTVDRIELFVGAEPEPFAILTGRTSDDAGHAADG